MKTFKKAIKIIAFILLHAIMLGTAWMGLGEQNPRLAIVGGIVVSQLMWMRWLPNPHHRSEGDKGGRTILRLLGVTALSGVILALAPLKNFLPLFWGAVACVGFNYAVASSVLGVSKSLQDQKGNQTFKIFDVGAIEAGVGLMIKAHVFILIFAMVINLFWLERG